MKNLVKVLFCFLLTSGAFAQHDRHDSKIQKETAQKSIHDNQKKIVLVGLHDLKVIASMDNRSTEKNDKSGDDEKKMSKSSKKFWYIIGGAAIVGGTVAMLFLKNGKKDNRIPEPSFPPQD